MKSIAIDGHMIGERETGNETYVVQLAAALARIGGFDYRLYATHPRRVPQAIRRAQGLTVRTLPNVPAPMRLTRTYPRLVRTDAIDLLHMTYVAPPRPPCPVVLTVHDVSYRIFPEFFSPRVRLILGLMVGPSVRHAARVITDSQAARRDIIRFYRVSPDKVVVTPAAAGPQYYPQPPGEVERIRRAYDLNERYLLAVGNVQPRKNLPRLVEAFARIASEASDVQLVIVGRSTWKGSEVEATVHRLGVTGRVRFTHYVPDAHLPGLYTGAVTLCYPSLYEGFGLPPLEAMACGTPAVTSNVSSLPEVVGDAAITVNPRSVDEIARALRCMLLDESLRIEYSRRGLARAAMFSWEKTAMLTRKVYEVVLGC